MAAPATEMLRELEAALLAATEQGTTVSFPDMREEYAMGHDDLEAALDMLRTHGKAIEDSPGMWRSPFEDERPAIAAALSGRVPVSAEVDTPDEELEAARESAVAQAMRGPSTPPAGVWTSEAVSQPNVRITRGIADALNAEALGNLVKAGLEESDGVFLLEVV